MGYVKGDFDLESKATGLPPGLSRGENARIGRSGLRFRKLGAGTGGATGSYEVGYLSLQDILDAAENGGWDLGRWANPYPSFYIATRGLVRSGEVTSTTEHRPRSSNRPLLHFNLESALGISSLHALFPRIRRRTLGNLQPSR